jgi:hypothetical protein
LYVYISARTHVVGEVPAYVVGVVIDDDLIGVPIPAIAEGDVIGCDVPVPAVEPEARWTTALDAPHMRGAETAGEVAVFPWVIEVVVNVVAASVVTYPVISRVNVRNIGMAGGV